MESKYVVVLLIAMFGMWTTAERLNGPCPRNHKIVEKIDWLMMHDRWFVMKQSNLDEDGAVRCTQAQISYGLPYLNFTSMKLAKNKENADYYEKVSGRGLVRDSGRLSVFVQRKESNWNDVLLEVLDTDYYNFALIYYCRNTGPFSSYQGSYVMSRTSTLNKELYPRMDKRLKENGLNTTNTFQRVVQNCGRIQCHGDYTSCAP